MPSNSNAIINNVATESSLNSNTEQVFTTTNSNVPNILQVLNWELPKDAEQFLDMDIDLDLSVNNISSLKPYRKITNNFLEINLQNIKNHLTEKKDNQELNNFIHVYNSTTNTNNNNLEFSAFILDFAATMHIISDISMFTTFTKCSKIVNWGKAHNKIIQGFGNVYIKFKDTRKSYIMHNALYIPELGINLISHNQIKQTTKIFYDDKIVYLFRNKQLITKGKYNNGLYFLPIEVQKPKQPISIYNTVDSNTINIDKVKNFAIWHQRFGHISEEYIKKLKIMTEGFSEIPITKNLQNHNIKECQICLQGKFTNKINHKETYYHEEKYLKKVASDIGGPINPSTYNGYKYFISFIDKATRYISIKLLKTKDETLQAFKEFKVYVENNDKNLKIKILVTDHGREFENKQFAGLLSNYGILHQMSAPYAKEQNGLIERTNRILMNKVRCMLYQVNLPFYLWGEALLTAVYLYNRTPHSALNYITPYEKKNEEKPDISHIRVFGSITFYKVKTNTKKLDPKANKGILLGFNENVYKIWDIEKKKPILSRDVIILENTFIQINKNKEENQNIIEIKSNIQNENNIYNNNSLPNIENPNLELNENSSNNEEVINFNGSSTQALLTSNEELPPIILREEDKIYNDEQAFIITGLHNEPNTFK